MTSLTLFLIMIASCLSSELSISPVWPSQVDTLISRHNAISSIANSPEYFSKIVALNSTTWIVSDGYKIWKTTNAGDKWTSPLFPGTQINPESQVGGICFVSMNVGFIFLGNRLFKTESMGDDWVLVSRIVSDASNFFFEDIFFTDLNTGWAVGTRLNSSQSKIQKAPVYEGFILATTDSGRTWKEQLLPKGLRPQNEFKKWPLRSIFFATKNMGCVVGDGVIFYTSNAGNTWSLAKSPRYDFNKVRFLDSMFGWAIIRGSKSIIITNDGGRSWKIQSITVPCNAGTMNAEFVSSDAGISICPLLYSTDDVGKTWRRVKIDGGNSRLAYDYLVRAINGTFVAINIRRSKVSALTSSNNGSTWEIVR